MTVLPNTKKGKGFKKESAPSRGKTFMRKRKKEKKKKETKTLKEPDHTIPRLGTKRVREGRKGTRNTRRLCPIRSEYVPGGTGERETGYR